MATYNFDIFHETHIKIGFDKLSLDYDITIYENKINIYYEAKNRSVDKFCSYSNQCKIYNFTLNIPYMNNTFNNNFIFKISENTSQKPPPQGRRRRKVRYQSGSLRR